jgi:hypothetical protein
VVGAGGADQSDLGRAADAGHLGAERLGDLHGEQAHPARRTDDEHLLSRGDVTCVADRGEGGGR